MTETIDKLKMNWKKKPTYLHKVLVCITNQLYNNICR